MNSKVLLLGSSGNLGGALKLFFLNHRIPFAAPSRYELDISKPGSVFSIIADYNPGFVVNCTAMNGINQCSANVLASIRLNSLFPRLIAARSHELGYRFIHFSTECVFNDSDNIIPSTQIPVSPTTIYGSTKLAGEPPIDPSVTVLIRLPLLISTKPNNQIVWRILNALQIGEIAKASTDVYSTPVYIDDVARRVSTIIQENMKFGSPMHMSSDIKLSLYQTVLSMADLHKISVSRLEPALDAEFSFAQEKPRQLGLKSTNDFFRVRSTA